MANPNPESQAGSSAAAQLEADVKRAVEQGLNLQDQVHQLTLAQISSGKFDLAALRELSQAVLNGALAGAQPLQLNLHDRGELIKYAIQKRIIEI